MFGTSFISFSFSTGSLDISQIPILVDSNDWPGIHIAVENLATDLERVTGYKPAVLTNTDQPEVDAVILVGSLDRSIFINKLPDEGTQRQQWLNGKRESFHTAVQDSVFSFAKRLLVIAGSDKRGTIFGVYTLSEQIGVSPWYWWADVPVHPRERLYALPISTRDGEPSVQYRGLFINDEAPALSDWVHENFGPKLNSKFYKKVFELLLRMKANFLWPAMWSGFPEPGSIFFLDDPENQRLADLYGIVVSTSHHEPMQNNMSEWRMAQKGEWDWEQNKSAITEFFTAGVQRAQPFESILTLGMRGDSDGEINAHDPKSTLRDVIITQRDIIKSLHGEPDGVGQVMALYKEVQEYYEQGLEIPDDVTLLFADDNFGNIRRLPNKAERARRGGAGVYYHLEYVGGPRSYKWLNSSSCGKIHQQLSAAYRHEASKIWVFNVGDIKPQELPLTFALALAWNIDSITPTNIPNFFHAYAEREFGSVHAQTISQLLLGHDRLMALRKHEHIEPETFSVLNYREADSVVSRYRALESQASDLFDTLPTTHKASFFQLVLHPIQASQINTELRVTQAKNQLYGLQRRNTTNHQARLALKLFDDDFNLSELYHDNPWVGKKWNHIMKQAHYGYSADTWHAPSRDMITGLAFVQMRQNSNNIAGQMGVAVEGHTGIRPGLVNEESDRMQPSRGDLVTGLSLPPLSPYGVRTRYFEVFSRGKQALNWTAEPTHAWICLSRQSGRLSPEDEEDDLVEVSVDWSKVPAGFNGVVHIYVRSSAGDYEQVHLAVENHLVPESFIGFVESDQHISIDVGAVDLQGDQRQFYQHLPYIGQSNAGGIALAVPVTAKSEHPWLEYPVFIFSSRRIITVSLYFTMTLQYSTEESLLYEISIGNDSRRSMPLLNCSGKSDLPDGWATAVLDGVWVRDHAFPDIVGGSHCVQYRPLARGLVLQKLVVDVGGLRESYLGPPASQWVGKPTAPV